MGRDDRLDLIRGYAMAVIALTHLNVIFDNLGMQQRQLPVPGDFSFTSAAELFFLLSGYMVGMVYVGRGNVVAKTLSRAGEIYRINLAAFAVALAIAWLGGSELAAATDADYTLAAPLRGIVEFLLMRQHPYLLGVLQVYVLFMLLTPLAAALLQRSTYLLALLSLALYIAVQLSPHWNFYGGGPHDTPRAWNFNPFAWQLPYCIGMIAGTARWHVSLLNWIGARSWRAWGLLGIAIGFTVLHRLDVRDLIDIPFTDKASLGVTRLVNTAILLGALAALLVICRGYLGWWPFRLLSMLGRQTLYCYAASIVITYAVGWAWLSSGRAYSVYFLSAAALMIVLLAVAYGRERLTKRPPQRAIAGT
ncbi:OpgC domain-containing protein [Dongia rigui]|uniref:OpgC domain-containing protein n=1 Tax=Dongia rigui TaxID=940149 RepID=A0ABU5E4P0_9PROT|nr:OpgC domain-containing protein [Dongia rigui]MDY0874144.1 OpgC domain-containing protein [Dongia rigui]